MTENWKENPQEDLESKLTLYVMGEADEATCAEVEAALHEDENLRAMMVEMQSTLELLRAPQLQPVLGLDRRDALRAAAVQGQGDAPQGKLLQFPVVRMAAALLVFGGLAAVWSNSGQDLAPENSQVASAPADAKPKAALMQEVGYSSDFAPAEEVESESSLDALGYSEPREFAELGFIDLPSASGAGGGTLGRETYLGPGDSYPPDREATELGAKVFALQAPQGGGAADLQVEELWRLSQVPPKQPTALPSTPSTPGLPDASQAPSTPAESKDKWSRGKSDGLIQSERQRDQLRDQPAPEANGKRPRGRFEDELSKQEAGAEVGLEFRGLGYDTRTAGGEDGFSFDDSGSSEPPICSLTDGYGRTYQDQAVLDHLRPISPQETARDMFFRFYGDNPEVYARVEALSTFAADVDTASYPMARNYLVNNQLPPKAAIRTEEFLNYFDYAMAAPSEDDFAVHLQASDSKFGDDGDLLLSIGIKAREVAAAERPVMNLVFVIDKSGSMAGERMQLVKDALMLLVDQIRDTDTIGLVTFDSTGQVVLEPTSGRERYRIREAIRSLQTGGSTNAGQGLTLGYGLAEKVFDADAINRVVLASDGVANTGETDQMRILQTVQARAEAKVDLTTLGVGMGNHNDVFLEQLADKGNGSCHYLDDVEEAKRVLVDGFLGTMITVARDVKIQVEFDPEQVLRWRQLGYENRSLAHADFRKDEVDAGEIGSGHEVIALYEVQPNPEADAQANMVTVRLRWKPEGSERAVEREYRLDLQAAQGRYELASVRLRQMAVVSQYSEVLRRSWHARMDSYQELIREAQGLAKELSGEAEVVELSRMIQRTSELARWAPPQDELSLLLEEARRQRILEAELVSLVDRGEAEEILLEVRRQNQLLEDRLQEMLQRD